MIVAARGMLLIAKANKQTGLWNRETLPFSVIHWLFSSLKRFVSSGMICLVFAFDAEKFALSKSATRLRYTFGLSQTQSTLTPSSCAVHSGPSVPVHRNGNFTRDRPFNPYWECVMFLELYICEQIRALGSRIRLFDQPDLQRKDLSVSVRFLH